MTKYKILAVKTTKPSRVFMAKGKLRVGEMRFRFNMDNYRVDLVDEEGSVVRTSGVSSTPILEGVELLRYVTLLNQSHGEEVYVEIDEKTI